MSKLWAPSRRKLLLGGASLIASPAILRAQVPMTGGGLGVPKVVSSGTPATIFGANLKAWYSPTLGRTGSSPVTAWADQSGVGQDLTATGSPTYSATGFGGVSPGITIIAASNLHRNSSFTIGPSNILSVCMVIDISSTADSQHVMSFVSPSGNHDVAPSFSIAYDHSFPEIYGYTQSPTLIAGTSGNLATATQQTVLLVFDGAHAQLYLGSSGAFVASGTAQTFSTTVGGTNGSIFFGQQDGGGGGQSLLAIGDVVFTDTAMTSQNRTDLYTYLKATYPGLP